MGDPGGLLAGSLIKVYAAKKLPWGSRGSQERLVTTDRFFERRKQNFRQKTNVGAQSPHIQRPDQGPVAGQAAYGVVGRFSGDPISRGRFVLMDYRSDHLSEQQRREPPTFLYAMDLGDGVFFVEETSLRWSLGRAIPAAR